MIYYIRHIETGLIKIGLSTAVSIRMKNLAAFYGELELLGFHDGDIKVEKEMHQRFAPRARGILSGKEWFNPTPELMAHIQANTRLENDVNVEPLKPLFYPPKQVKPVDTEIKGRFESALPDLIKAYLNQTGMTRQELAQLVGIDGSTLSRLLYSKPRMIDMNMAEKFRKVIGFQPHQLLKTVYD